ncbi:phosphoesterase, Pap2 family [Nitratiruptor sp. SB155-2]|nr:phosphoesterase, Pap2 family [Nitratiruptor sp. SB155-2]
MNGIETFMGYSLVALFAALFSYFFFDIQIAQYFHTHSFAFFKIITHLGNAVPYLLFGLGIYLLYRKKDPLFAKKGVFLIFAIILSGIVTTLLKITIGRPRPKIYFHDHLYNPQFFQFKAAYWSMPSGHTTTIFAAMVALGFIYPKFRYFFWIVAILVGLSRVVLTQHFLSDVIVGALIGTLCAIWLHKRMFHAS